LPVWCQDEGGPYQAIPQPGASWQPEGQPARQPHEYVRGGTAKLLLLFRPSTGQVRAEPVEQTTNAVLHPWLKDELEQILAQLPPSVARSATELPAGHWWSEWGWSDEQISHWRELPPIRMILVWDNLTGHYTWEMVRWCIERGILLLYTPLGGSWLNMAESMLRILTRRALAGQHAQSAAELRNWLAAAVRGWNAAPTPFEWGGRRAERRQRARDRRHRLGGSGAWTRRPILRPPRTYTCFKGCVHAN
jgi:hypothetical protein